LIDNGLREAWIDDDLDVVRFDVRACIASTDGLK
jgi:hypothetical protein